MYKREIFSPKIRGGSLLWARVRLGGKVGGLGGRGVGVGGGGVVNQQHRQTTKDSTKTIVARHHKNSIISFRLFKGTVVRS